jgi:excisionase family DNA binding protein
MAYELLTLSEAAAYLKMSPKTLYNWHSLGKIKGVKLGGLKFARSELDKLIEERVTNNGVHN